jgi:hypothetical protein
MLGVADFGEKHGRRDLGEGVAETEEDTATHESVDVLAATLDDGTDNHDNTANGNGKLAAEVIGKERDDRDRDQGTNLIEGTNETEKGTFGVLEVILPLIHVLDGVEKHAIVTGGRGGNAKNNGEEVELAKAWILAPIDFLKLRSLLLGDLGRTSLGLLIEDAHVDGFNGFCLDKGP